MSFHRSSTDQSWMHNFSDRIGGVNNAGTSHMISLTNPLRSSFSASLNGRFTQMHNGSSPFNSSDGKNLGLLGMSHSRLSLKNVSGGSMEVESASSFGSSVNGCVQKEPPKYAVPARFNSSFGGKAFTGPINGSFNSTSQAPHRNFTSSFSMESGIVNSISLFDNYAQEQSVRSAMSVANSFHGSAGSSKGSGRSAQQPGNKFATSFIDLSSSVRFRQSKNAASIESGPADLNSFVPSLDSFGQMKPDYLGLEAAKKKFQNSR